MADFTMKANDLLPPLEATLGFESMAGVPDLSDPATVVSLIMRKDGDAQPKVNSQAVIVDVATAKVRYDWATGDTDIPGVYKAEWEVVYADGKPQTFPTKSYHEIEILADLDEGA